MKLFSEFLAEEDKKEKSGTYAALLPSPATRMWLHKWMEQQNIKEMVDAKDYHCTVVYSTTPVPEIKDIPVDLPMKTSFKEWKVFGDDKMLVATLNAPEAVKLFEQTIKAGAVSEYPSYVPHISVALHYEGELPEKEPKFSIWFEKFKVAPLDEDFKYNDD